MKTKIVLIEHLDMNDSLDNLIGKFIQLKEKYSEYETLYIHYDYAGISIIGEREETPEEVKIRKKQEEKRQKELKSFYKTYYELKNPKYK